MGWSGLWITEEEEDLLFYEEFGEVDYLGNHGLPFVSHELHIEQLD